MMQRPSVERLLAAMERKQYRVFNTPGVDWNLNIVGIRNRSDSPAKFDDLLAVFHQFMGNWDVAYYPVTTDPSDKYLREPVNVKGTAILCEGQYPKSHAIGMHKAGKKGAHKALCQVSPVTVFRDNTRDGKLNYVDPDTGMFGINIHRGPMNGDMDSDNSVFSAGCQVFADRRHFDEFMLKCLHGADAFGNSFTYTLLNERDLD